MEDLFRNRYPSVNLLDAQNFEANQRGEITAAQLRYFSSQLAWKRMILIMVVFVLFCVIFSFLFLPVFSHGKGTANFSTGFIVAGILTLLMIFQGYVVWGPLFRYVRFRRDVATHAFRQGQGQLVHGKKGYVFDLGSSTLSMPGGQPNGLEPGTTYQVYFLDESRFFLSAAVSHQASPAQAQSALNEILASAIGFRADDVLANQQGEVTFIQRRKLLPRVFGGALIALGSMAFLIPFVLLPLLSTPKTPVVLLIFLILLVAILPIVGSVILIKALLDILTPKLDVIQGIAFKEHRVVNTGRSSHVEYYYSINQKRFHVSYRAYTALVDGLEYRLYYLPRTKKLISIEVLKGRNPSF